MPSLRKDLDVVAIGTTASLFLGTAIHIDLLTMFSSSSLVILNMLLGASVLFETLQLVKRRVQPSLLSF